MTGERIERWPGSAAGRVDATAYRDLVFAVATAHSDSPSIREQTAMALSKLDERLAAAGADKTRILSATVYITDMAQKAEMDAVWVAWMGECPGPQRACVAVGLHGDDLVEITAVAARG